MQVRFLILIITIFLFISCFNNNSGILVINNTTNLIQIECQTIYDNQIYGSNDYGDIVIGYMKLKHNDLQILYAPLILEKQNEDYLLYIVHGIDIINALGYGKMENIDDVVTAIDEIFISLNIYSFMNGKKELLYDKEYFLDKNNLEIPSKGKGFIKIIIN